MAFRKFSEAAPMRAARFEGLPNVIGAVQTAGLAKAKKEAAAAKSKQDRIDKIAELDLSIKQGAYISDNEEFQKRGEVLVNNMISEVTATGQESNENRLARQKLSADADASKLQLETANRKRKAIADNKDPYYHGNLDYAKVTDEEAKPFGERDIDSVELGESDTFLREQHLADHIKAQIEKYAKTTTTDAGETKTTIEEPFITETGQSIVTDQDARDYINSRKDFNNEVSGFYDDAVDFLLDDEIRAMQESNLPEHAWMDGLSNNDIKTKVINDPSLNSINSDTWARRKLKMAKQDLRKGIKTNRLFDIDNTSSTDDKPDKVETRMAATSESRYETLGNAVFDMDEAALQTVFGGVKGVKEVKFDYAEKAFPAKDAKTVIKINIPEGGEDNWLKPIPFGTLKEKEAAIIKLNKYMDDEVKGTPNYVGGDRVLRLMEKDARFNPDKRPKAKY